MGTADLLPGGMERVPLRQLQQGPLIVLDPQKCPDEYRALLHHILADHSPMGVYFCDAVEAAVVLAQAGYGIATLPDFLLNRIPSLTYVPVSDVQPMSYGVYYKTLSGHPLRKAFVSILADHFSGVDT